MMETRVQDDGTNRGIIWWVLTAFACGIVGWLVLRQPEVRNGLLGLVPHRQNIEAERVRQMLAPRCVLFGGFLVGAVLAGLVLCGIGRGARQGKWMVVLGMVITVQAVIAVATAINAPYFFQRQFGRLPGSIPEEEILTYVVPQGYPDSRILARLAAPTARFAYKADTQDVFFLPSFNYPQAFFECFPEDEDKPVADPGFAISARENRLTHWLHYTPQDRENPMRFGELR
ncbi:MAG: hypothetical protein K1X53_05060 [Candidatus Sumerlaeaceae bacterium]|nr:hypothetical protein [Candidatus Sumerlaeaceae bacterium]